LHECTTFASIFDREKSRFVVSKPEKDYDSDMGRFFRSVANEALNPNLAHKILEGANGSYRIESMIAKGGMGATVYLAQGSDGDRVALKLLPEVVGENQALTKRFLRETRSMVITSHPNVVPYLDHGQSPDGDHFIVMEYIPGGSLAKHKLASAQDSIKFVADACRGLAELHRNGITHRDIKPSNILIGNRGEPKICDFGLAKILRSSHQSSPLTRAGDRLGTDGFMAPEQLTDSTTIDHRADIFSLGAVLYRLLTGTAPVGRFPAPSAVSQDLAVYDRVVMKALATIPSQRFQSAEEFREELLKVTSNDAHVSRRKIIAAGVSTTALLAVGGFVWLAGKERSPLWDSIDLAQSRITSAGDHDITLALTQNRTVRFTITLTDSPIGYKVQPFDAPRQFNNPIHLSSLASLMQRGSSSGLLARLALQSIEIVLPDRPSETVRLSNLSELNSELAPYRQFLSGCRLLDQCFDRDLLRVEDLEEPKMFFAPGACDDYPALCKALGLLRMEIAASMAEENLMVTLVRVATYELLRRQEAKRFPGYNGHGDTTINAFKMRSMVDGLAALVAEKWLFQRPHASEAIDAAFECIYDSEASHSESQVTVDAVNGLLESLV
jgi:serine/threonine protein kinase